MSKNNNDNRSNQMNPNNDAYWQSRGTDERPDYWEEEYQIIEEHQLTSTSAHFPFFFLTNTAQLKV